MNELMTLHHFFYQAAEHYFDEQGLSFRHGLSLFPAWLQERDINALDTINQIQETVRAIKHQQQ